MVVQIGTANGSWHKGDSEGAQAFYRLWPFAWLREIDPEIVVVDDMGYGLGNASRVDWLVMHQPMNATACEIAENAKEIGTRIWVDMDDLIIENHIPPANQFAAIFREKAISESLKTCLGMADVVSVSTNTLKKALVFYGYAPSDKIHVIPNALPDWAWNKRSPYRKPAPRPLIAWRGSQTHTGDLMLLRDAFTDYPNLDFLFIGSEPWPLYERYGGKLSKVLLKDWTRGQAKYFKALKAEQPDYSVVCLENVAFNHAKSNISMLEFMLAGAPTIAPAYMPEFNIPGVIQYGNPKAAPGEHNADSLAAIFRHIDEGKDIGHREAYQACEEYISNNLVLSVVNKQRLNLLYAQPTKANT